MTGLLPMLLARRAENGGGFFQRFQQQNPYQPPPAQPVPYYNMQGDFGALPHQRAAEQAYANHLQRQATIQQAMELQQINPPTSSAAMSGFGADFGAEEFGAEEEAEDEEDVGMEEQEEALYAAAMAGDFGAGRILQWRQDRAEKKRQKWENKNPRTRWGKNRQDRKIKKWTKREDKLAKKNGNVQSKSGGAAAAGAAGLLAGGALGQQMIKQVGDPSGMNYFVQPPAPSGRLVRLPLRPKTAPSGEHAGGTDDNMVKTTVPASGTSSEIELVTAPAPWGQFKVMGLAASVRAQRDSGSEVFFKELKSGNGSNLFFDSGWQSAADYDAADIESSPGLRAQPIIVSPNVISLKVRVQGDNSDVVKYGLSLIVDIMADEVAGEPIRVQRGHSPYAG